MRKVLLTVALMLCSCWPTQGPPGPQGQTGEVGPAGPKGDRGDPAPAVKTLHLIDPAGVDLGRAVDGACYWHDGVQGVVCPIRLAVPIYFLQYDCQGPGYTYPRAIANSYFVYKGSITAVGSAGTSMQTFPSNLGTNGCQSGVLTKWTGMAPVISLNVPAASYEFGDLTYDLR